MNKILLTLFIIISALTASYAQTIVKDANGNFTAVKSSRDTAQDINTGKTYTDTKGHVFSVYQSKRGKLYALVTSKNGVVYKKYLKPSPKKQTNE